MELLEYTGKNKFLSQELLLYFPRRILFLS